MLEHSCFDSKNGEPPVQLDCIVASLAKPWTWALSPPIFVVLKVWCGDLQRRTPKQALKLCTQSSRRHSSSDAPSFPGRQVPGTSLDSTTPTPTADAASAARLHRLKRMVGVAVGAGVLLSFEPRPIVGGAQLVFGIYKPPRHPRKPSKAAAADLPKAVSAGGSAKAPAAGVTKGAAAASNKAAPDVSTKAAPDKSLSRSADLLHNYRQLSGQVADVSWRAFDVAGSGFMKLALAPTKHKTLLRRLRNKLNGEGYKTPGYMDLRVINTDSRESSSPCAFGIGKPADSLRVGLAAGAVLCTQTNEELASIMACEVGHSFAYHEAERKSWRLLLNTVIIGSLAASSSMGLLPLAAAAIGIDAVVNKVIVGIWLHRRQ